MAFKRSLYGGSGRTLARKRARFHITTPRKAARAGVRKFMRKRQVATINRVLGIRQELKKAQFLPSPTTFNSGINVTGDIQRIMPSIPEGTGSDERIGQSVRLRKLVIRGIIQFNPAFDAGNTDLEEGTILPRLFLVRHKRFERISDVPAAALEHLIERGQSGALYDGTIQNHFLPINTEIWTKKKDKRYKLQARRSSQTGAAAGGQINMAGVGTDMRTFTWTMKFGKNGKKLNYEPGESVPINFPYLMLAGYAFPNNNASPDTAEARLQLSYSVIAYYNDM